MTCSLSNVIDITNTTRTSQQIVSGVHLKVSRSCILYCAVQAVNRFLMTTTTRLTSHVPNKTLGNKQSWAADSLYLLDILSRQN